MMAKLCHYGGRRDLKNGADMQARALWWESAPRTNDLVKHVLRPGRASPSLSPNSSADFGAPRTNDTNDLVKNVSRSGRASLSLSPNSSADFGAPRTNDLVKNVSRSGRASPSLRPKSIG